MNAIKKYKRSLVSDHNALWRAILDRYSDGDYTLDNPLIVNNPFKNSPLTAVILFSSGCAFATSAVIRIEGQSGDKDLTHEFNDGSQHNYHFIPVAGLYPGIDNNVELTLTYSDGSVVVKSFTIRTPELPKDIKLLPNIHPGKSEPIAMAEGFTFLSPINSYIMAVDHNATIRWYLSGDDYFLPGNFPRDLAFTNFIRLKNGNFLVNFWKKCLYEITILGRCVKFTDLTKMRYGLHHDMYEMESGDLLVCIEDHFSNIMEDHIGIFDYQHSNTLKKYADFKEVLPTKRVYQPNIDSVLGGKKDWLHINRAVYHQEKDFFVISARHQNAIIASKEISKHKYGKMDMELQWILGSHYGWEPELKKYLLRPIDSFGNEITDNDFLDKEFWPWGQHSINFIDTNNSETSKDPDEVDIILFNNGNYRSFDKRKQIRSDNNYSEGVHYRINTKHMTVKIIWRFGKELGSQRYCSFVCNIQELKDSYLINYGGIHLNEYGENIGLLLGDPPMQRGEKVYPKTYICEVNKSSKEIVFDFELDIGESEALGYYNFKSLRLPMYPNKSTIRAAL
ncbi:aryl-sulfate sulfotransferase [Serratia odorifera]|uniref:aryl-sulfate sulfotransferase n=1 Tax=Serratia odorifera TaxID=618 RepID=UPI003531EE06